MISQQILNNKQIDIKITQISIRKSNKHSQGAKQNISQEGINMIGQMKKDMQLLKNQLKRYNDFRNSSVDENELKNSNDIQQKVTQRYKIYFNTPNKVAKRTKSNVFLINKVRTQQTQGSPFVDTNDFDQQNFNLDDEIMIQKGYQNHTIVPRRSYYQDNIQTKTKKKETIGNYDQITNFKYPRLKINELNFDSLLQKNKTLISEILQLKNQQKNTKNQLIQTVQCFNKQKMRWEQDLMKQRYQTDRLVAELYRLQTLIKQIQNQTGELKIQNQVLNKELYELNFQKDHLKNLIKILQNHIKISPDANTLSEQNLILKKQLENKMKQIANLKIFSLQRGISQVQYYQLQNYKSKLKILHQEKDINQKIINDLEQTIKKLLVQNKQKDQFMKNFLINKVQKSSQNELIDNINQFFDEYRINVPQYNLSKYIFQQIQKKLGQIVLH